jgi:hypothetical protein
MQGARPLRFLWLLLLAVLTPPPACHAAVSLSAAAVQGDGAHTSAASEFLTGCNYSCEKDPTCTCSSPLMHLPRGGPRLHLHLDENIPDYSKFYVDRLEGGQDDNSANGLEGSQLLFYAGDGMIDSFDVLQDGNSVALSKFSLGDGKVLYLWMLSCQVFAHGPRQPSPGHVYQDFIRPDKFDPQASALDPANHPNVFGRWAKASDGRSPLNPGLRLACGGSSHIGDIDHPTQLVWHYYSNLGLGPAESFLLGLYKPESFGIPLCMSRGGATPESSGLYDPRFVADRPQAGLPFVYIEYPVAGDGSDPVTTAATGEGLLFTQQRKARTDEPAGLPVLVVKEPPIPAFINKEKLPDAPLLDYGFRGGSAQSLGIDLASIFTPAGLLSDALPLVGANFFSESNVCVKRHPGTGTMVFSLQVPSSLHGFSEDALSAILAGLGRSALLQLLRSEVPPPPTAPPWRLVLRDAQPVVMHVDGVLASKLAGPALQPSDIVHSTKCTYLRLSRVYTNPAGVEVPVLGEGGDVLFSFCPRLKSEESPFSGDVCRPDREPGMAVAYSNRIVTDTRDADLKTRAAAQEEAWKALADRVHGAAAFYEQEPDSYTWGYRASPPHCRQEEMYIVYEFVFVPKPAAALQGHGPVTIEIPAHPLPNGAQRIEDTWQCSTENGD